MSAPLLLRVFVTERLTAAAEEILQVFERTIEKYEEEASRSKQENDRLRGLLQEFSHHRGLFSPYYTDYIMVIISITLLLIKAEFPTALNQLLEYS